MWFRSLFERAANPYKPLPDSAMSSSPAAGHACLTLPANDGYRVPKRLGWSRARTLMVMVLVFITVAVFKWPATSKLPVPPPLAGPKTALYAQIQAIFDANAPATWFMHPHPLGRYRKERLDTLIRLTTSQARRTRAAHAQVVAQLPEYPEGVYSPGSKGIVILAGGWYTEFAMTGVGMLRSLGSKLSIEIWMRDINEAIPGVCDDFALYGNVTCRYLSDHIDFRGSRQFSSPYQWKVFAMLLTNFEQVLFLDADNLPVANPDTVFETARYQKQGVIIWPDYWKHSGSQWLPYIVGLADGESEMFRQGGTAEAGQLVWNKKQQWQSLLLAAYYNYYGPDFYYTVISLGWNGWGDKDTFYIAPRALGHDIQMEQYLVTGYSHRKGKGIAMLQADPSYPDYHRPMWSHANAIKSGIRRLMCDPSICDIPYLRRFKWYMRERGSGIAAAIQNGERIWDPSAYTKYGMDPEPLLWQTLRNIACRSRVFGTPKLCGKVQEYVKKAFPELEEV